VVSKCFILYQILLSFQSVFLPANTHSGINSYCISVREHFLWKPWFVMRTGGDGSVSMVCILIKVMCVLNTDTIGSIKKALATWITLDMRHCSYHFLTLWLPLCINSENDAHLFRLFFSFPGGVCLHKQALADPGWSHFLWNIWKCLWFNYGLPIRPQCVFSTALSWIN